MNTLLNKVSALVLTATLGLAFTATSANANQVTADNNLTQVLITQSQSVAKALSYQLSTSIAAELNRFSIDNSIILSPQQSVDTKMNSEHTLVQQNNQNSKNTQPKTLAE